MRMVVPTPNLTVNDLQTGDIVRFVSPVDNKSIIEAAVTSMTPGAVNVSVDFRTLWVEIDKLQLVDGAWGRPISQLIGYDPDANEVVSLRSQNHMLQQATNNLRIQLTVVQNDLDFANKNRHADYAAVCAERDALAAELTEALR